MRLAAALAILFGSAACSQGDSDNVMAASANALTPAQVDLALGPELANNEGDALNSANGVNAAGPANAVEAAETEDSLDESFAEEAAAANNNSEE